MALARNYAIADVMTNAPDFVIISPNDPGAMINLIDECREREIPFIYDPSQQVPRLNGDELKHGMRGAYLMVVNSYESSVICGKTGLSLDDLRDKIEILIITAGERGSTIYVGNEEMHVEAFAPCQILDPTGAGDAYRAGLLAGMACDLPLQTSAQVGALCATYALECIGTQNHDFTPVEFVRRFRDQLDDAGQLDSLLS